MTSGGVPDNRGSLGGSVTATPLCRIEDSLQIFIGGLPRPDHIRRDGREFAAL
jgi:hypothetical protein